MIIFVAVLFFVMVVAFYGVFHWATRDQRRFEDRQYRNYINSLIREEKELQLRNRTMSCVAYKSDEEGV